ncbi:MAG TPA: NAD-dependent epimerase/dehydratase family protein, partial [Fimbriimonadaceae bacterium]|nr:NAD-dependent epimerase/dehydratase family protein [Fimbriimonadaceae bacterium]
MKVLVAGGTGFIGSAVVEHLLDDGAEVVVTRRASSKAPTVSGVTYCGWDELPERVDAVVNLTGEWIVGRWTESK